MKNVTHKPINKQNDQQNRKLRNQVSHLSGFIGMPMWNGRNPTLSEIREYDRRLLEQQALEFEQQSFESVRKGSLNRLFTWIGAGMSTASASARISKARINITEKKAPVKGDAECC